MGQPLSSPQDLTNWAIFAFVAAIFYAVLTHPAYSNYHNKHSLNAKRPKISPEDEHFALYKHRRLNPPGPENPRSHLINRKTLGPQEINYPADTPRNFQPGKPSYKFTPQVQPQRERDDNIVPGTPLRRPRKIVNAQGIFGLDDELKFPANQGIPETAQQHYHQYGDLPHDQFSFGANKEYSFGKENIADLVVPRILEDKIPSGLSRKSTEPHFGVKARGISEAFQQVTSKSKPQRNRDDGYEGNVIESLQRNHSKMSVESIPELILDKKVSKMEEEEFTFDVDVSTRPSSYPQSAEKPNQNRENYEFSFGNNNFTAQPQNLFGGGPEKFGAINLNQQSNTSNNEKSSKEVFLDSNALTKNENSAQALISNLKKKSIKANVSQSTAIAKNHENSDILKKTLADCINLRVKQFEQEKNLKDLEVKITQNPLQAAVSVKTVAKWVDKEERTASHNTICLACKNCCHEACGLQRITVNGSEAFKSCAAFGNASMCKRCSHDYKMHVHLNLKYNKVMEMEKKFDVDTRQQTQNNEEIRVSTDAVRRELSTLNQEKQKLMNNITIFIGEMSSKDVRICIDAVKEQFKGHSVELVKKNCVNEIITEIEQMLARKNN